MQDTSSKVKIMRMIEHTATFSPHQLKVHRSMNIGRIHRVIIY